MYGLHLALFLKGCQKVVARWASRITSYNVCYTKLLRMYPNGILYTLTLDLNENKILSLRDLEDLDEVTDSLIECADLPMYDMNGERISKDWQSEIEAYLSEYKHKKLLEELKQFDLSVDKEYEPAGYSYFENGKLHICISVPHALGDYIDIVPDSYNFV